MNPVIRFEDEQGKEEIEIEYNLGDLRLVESLLPGANMANPTFNLSETTHLLWVCHRKTSRGASLEDTDRWIVRAFAQKVLLRDIQSAILIGLSNCFGTNLDENEVAVEAGKFPGPESN